MGPPPLKNTNLANSLMGALTYIPTVCEPAGLETVRFRIVLSCVSAWPTSVGSSSNPAPLEAILIPSSHCPGSRICWYQTGLHSLTCLKYLILCLFFARTLAEPSWSLPWSHLPTDRPSSKGQTVYWGDWSNAFFFPSLILWLWVESCIRTQNFTLSCRIGVFIGFCWCPASFLQRRVLKALLYFLVSKSWHVFFFLLDQ